MEHHITVTGPLSGSARAVIGDRFSRTTITSRRATTVVGISDADQPALRALVTLLWDLGYDVVALTRRSDQAEAAGGGHGVLP